jgi:hypothetical protein
MLLALRAAPLLNAQVSVATYQYDNSRAGANQTEAVLTPSNVSVATFGKLFAQAVDGMAYAQPLYLPNVTVPALGLQQYSECKPGIIPGQRRRSSR